MLLFQKNLLSNALLKVVALIFGYSIWLILAQHQPLKINHNIPLSFYLPNNTANIHSPSEITVHLLGKRLDFQKLDFKSLGVHIDISSLQAPGTYQIPITSEQIFLPNHIQLLYYSPVMINLELEDH